MTFIWSGGVFFRSFDFLYFFFFPLSLKRLMSKHIQESLLYGWCYILINVSSNISSPLRFPPCVFTTKNPQKKIPHWYLGLVFLYFAYGKKETPFPTRWSMFKNNQFNIFLPENSSKMVLHILVSWLLAQLYPRKQK